MAKSILAFVKVDLRTFKNPKGQTFLHLAAAYNQIELAKHLIEQGWNINEQDDIGFTPLHLAVFYNFVEMGEFLLKKGASTHQKTYKDKLTPLMLSLSENNSNNDFAEKLIAHDLDSLKHEDSQGLNVVQKCILQENYHLLSFLQKINRVNLCADENLKIALNANQNIFLLFKLVEKNTYLKDCLKKIIKNEKIACFLKDNKQHFSFDATKLLLLTALNQHKFNAANDLAEFMLELNQKEYMKCRDLSHQYSLEEDLDFPKYIALNEQIHYKNVFESIIKLLENPHLCIQLLKQLDQEIGNFESTLGIQFSKIKAENFFEFDGYLFPEIINDLNTQTKGLLRFLLRKQLQKFGIDKQDEMLTFFGFVNSMIADQWIKAGALFKEQYLKGHALFHGLYTHYLQWYIISRAVEENIISLPMHLTLKDILSASVDIKIKEGKTMWTILFDSINERTSDFHFRMPMHLNNVLLNCQELPDLSGLLTLSWCKKFSKLAEKTKKDNVTPSYKAIVMGQVMSNQFFDRLKLGITDEDKNNYYQSKGEVETVFNPETNIVIKKASQRFAFFDSLEKNERLEHSEIATKKFK